MTTRRHPSEPRKDNYHGPKASWPPASPGGAVLMSLDIILEALVQLENQVLQDIDEKVLTKREGQALRSLIVGLRDRLEDAVRANQR
jgi:hypothetical protein